MTHDEIMEMVDDAYATGYQQGRQNNYGQRIDLYKIEDTNPVVNVLWKVQMIKFIIMLGGLLCFLFYIGYLVLRYG